MLINSIFLWESHRYFFYNISLVSTLPSVLIFFHCVCYKSSSRRCIITAQKRCYILLVGLLVLFTVLTTKLRGKGHVKDVKIATKYLSSLLRTFSQTKGFFLKKCFSMNCLYYKFVFLAIYGCVCYFIMVAFATLVTLKLAKCCTAIFFHCLHLSLISRDALRTYIYICNITK